jgi:hypothetical protein
MSFEPYKFILISIDSFIEKQRINDPKIDTVQLKKDLLHFRKLKADGIKCNCGDELWVIGSAYSGKGCFTCITMETDCSEDYEIE